MAEQDILTPAETPEPEVAQAEPPKDPRFDQRTWTIKGAPIPEHLWHVVSYKMTDQYLAENPPPPRTGPMVDVISDPLDKKFAAELESPTSLEPWEGIGDPMKALIDEHIVPGQRPRFLSREMIRERGLRGYEVVRHPNGDPVVLGNMILGQMPEAKAQKRDSYYRNESAERITEAHDNFIEAQQRALHDVAGEALPTGSAVTDRENNRTVVTGLTRTRGELPKE